MGTELLLGQIDNTNVRVIAEQLRDAGIFSYEQQSVGDNPDRISRAVREILSRSDALIVTGGLGPTHDDITREVVADVMGAELVRDENVVASIEKFFTQRQREMPASNLRQAMVPVGAQIMDNPLGTAPGLICPVTSDGVTKNVYLMPGVPYEMDQMLRSYVIPDLLAHNSSSSVLVNRTLKSWGYGESALADALEDLVRYAETHDVKIGFLARGINGIYVKLSCVADSEKRAHEMISEVENEILSRIGSSVYGFDDDTMESVVINLLRERSLTLSCAESLTGGMVTSRLVDIAGASDVLAGGVVSYQVPVKKSVLGVEAPDVYSHECAREMARGVKELLGSSIALSVTGVAGPGSDDGHHAGEVYVGLADEHGATSEQFLLGGDRIRVREYATISALNVLRMHLLSPR